MSNAPLFETQDIDCEWCGKSCKELFTAPHLVTQKWDLIGYYHMECAIKAMVVKEIKRAKGFEES